MWTTILVIIGVLLYFIISRVVITIFIYYDYLDLGDDNKEAIKILAIIGFPITIGWIIVREISNIIISKFINN